MDFLFRRLKVYQMAINLAEELKQECQHIKSTGNYPMIEQMRKAAMSIPLNIAEGNGRSSQADKRRFFIIARGSCFEMASLLEIAERFEYMNKQGGSTSRMF